MTPHRPGRLDGGFIVRDSNGKPIGAVIVGANGRFAGWNRDGKLGEHAARAEAIAAVRKAHFARKRGEKRT
jgi:hypothetical protein